MLVHKHLQTRPSVVPIHCFFVRLFLQARPSCLNQHQPLPHCTFLMRRLHSDAGIGIIGMKGHDAVCVKSGHLVPYQQFLCAKLYHNRLNSWIVIVNKFDKFDKFTAHVVVDTQRVYPQVKLF